MATKPLFTQSCEGFVPPACCSNCSALPNAVQRHCREAYSSTIRLDDIFVTGASILCLFLTAGAAMLEFGILRLKRAAISEFMTCADADAARNVLLSFRLSWGRGPTPRALALA